jgi:hypothetical protein
MPKWFWRLFVPGGALLLLALGYLGTSSLRYGPNIHDYPKVKELAGQGDVAGLNQALLEFRSLSTKSVVLSFLSDSKDDSSIPVFVKMLSFDLPWYERLDTELKPTPREIRFSAHKVLASYGYERAGHAVVPLLESKVALERLYAAGIMTRWGDPVGERTLEELIQHGPKRIAEEAEWVLQKARSEK